MYSTCFLSPVEHVFEMSVEAVRGLGLRDNMIWGEADCFVQYHFPTQTATRHQGAPQVMNGEPKSVYSRSNRFVSKSSQTLFTVVGPVLTQRHLFINNNNWSMYVRDHVMLLGIIILPTS